MRSKPASLTISDEYACLISTFQQKCTNQNFAIAPFFDYGCDVSEVACLCQPPFRARAAACKTTRITGFEFRGLIMLVGEEIICDLQEFLSISLVAHPAFAISASLYQPLIFIFLRDPGVGRAAMWSFLSGKRYFGICCIVRNSVCYISCLGGHAVQSPNQFRRIPPLRCESPLFLISLSSLSFLTTKFIQLC